ncbi:MAG TPA: alkaline phosphatase family protein, partial [Jatrophihabitans sp.]|nr:alkaline phosphatase family protein [Jatrophihabitans sp.]
MAATISDVLPSAAALLGVPDATDRLRLRERFGDVRRVLVVLVDGMGAHLLPAMKRSAPLLASVLAGETGWIDELTCMFPSTTPTSLVSFGTGAVPGQHGVLGFTLNVPGTDRVLTHIAWRDDPPPQQWQPVPTWFQRMVRSGTMATVVLPSFFAGSGLTNAAYRGARFCGVERGEDYPRRLLDELATGPGLVYGYLSALDTAAHVHGTASAEWEQAGADVDAALTRLLENLPADAALLVTADHGGLDVGPTARIDMADRADLAADVRVVAGEPRVRYLHTVPGAAGDVLDRWRAALDERAEVLSGEEAIAQNWFGPMRDEHRARIGDVVVICTGELAILASGHEPPETSRLVGFHGGPTPVEMAIPLIGLRG